MKPQTMERKRALFLRAIFILTSGCAWFLPKDLNEVAQFPILSFLQMLLSMFPYAVGIHILLDNVGPVSNIIFIAILSLSTWWYATQFYW